MCKRFALEILAASELGFVAASLGVLRLRTVAAGGTSCYLVISPLVVKFVT